MSAENDTAPAGDLTTDHAGAEGDHAATGGDSYFRALVENALDIVQVVNRDGTIRYESPAVGEMTGYRPGERGGTSALNMLHEDDIPQARKAIYELTATPASTVHMDVRLRHKDGSLRDVEVVLRNLLDDPVVSGLVVGVRDITERKQTEESLRIKERALENSINAVAMTDMNGTITYVNRACMDLWGSPDKEELIGKPYMVLIESGEIVKDVAVAIAESQVWQGEVAAKRKDGEEVRVQVATSLVKDERGDPIQTVSSFVDITEARKAEDALRESEDKFRRFVEEMSDGYCVIQGSRVAFANARVAGMFGYDREEVIGRSIRDLLPSDIVGELTKVHTRRRRGEAVPSQYQAILTAKDGTQRPVEFGTSLTQYEGRPAVSLVVRDVTERRQMEEALKESETLFRTIFEGATVSMALVGVDGKPLALNPALEQLTGYSLADLSDMHPADYIHPEDAAAEMALFREVATGERNQGQIEKRYVRRNGEVVWAHQTLSLVRNADGEPQYVIAMIEDITERKRAELENQRLEEQLLLAGRLAAVGELAAGVAHELNNPLAAVQAFAQLLVSRTDIDQTAKSDLETIYSEAQRATRITGNLLSFARRHRPEKCLVLLNEVLEKSLELHAYQMRLNGIEVFRDLDPDLPMTMTDPHQMHQVFVNIIRNAEQAMTKAHRGGKLRVKTETAGDLIRITFSDNGPGISGGNSESIFDPFFTTKDVGEGTGLGLSICYGIVEGHGGRIYARGKPGKGADFVVEIPILSHDDVMADETSSTHTLVATPRFL